MKRKVFHNNKMAVSITKWILIILLVTTSNFINSADSDQGNCKDIKCPPPEIIENCPADSILTDNYDLIPIPIMTTTTTTLSPTTTISPIKIKQHHNDENENDNNAEEEEELEEEQEIHNIKPKIIKSKISKTTTTTSSSSSSTTISTTTDEIEEISTTNSPSSTTNATNQTKKPRRKNKKHHLKDKPQEPLPSVPSVPSVGPLSTTTTIMDDLISEIPTVLMQQHNQSKRNSKFDIPEKSLENHHNLNYHQKSKRHAIDQQLLSTITNENKLMNSLLLPITRLRQICCPKKKCVCRDDCEKIFCIKPHQILVEITPSTNIPGKCCPKYECVDTEPICVPGGDIIGKTYWPSKCQQCVCFHGTKMCHEGCPQNEQTQHCLSPVTQKIYQNGQSWKENDCTDCECTDGIRQCQMARCNQPNFNCKKLLKIPGQCCLICQDDIPTTTINPLTTNLNNQTTTLNPLKSYTEFEFDIITTKFMNNTTLMPMPSSNETTPTIVTTTNNPCQMIEISTSMEPKVVNTDHLVDYLEKNYITLILSFLGIIAIIVGVIFFIRFILSKINFPTYKQVKKTTDNNTTTTTQQQKETISLNPTMA